MSLLLSLLTAAAIVVGSPLPAWQEGYLDIHAINSGRGECTFFILPDGTTLLVDAGESYGRPNHKYAVVPPRPDAQTPAYMVYAKYLRRFLPARSKGTLDYVLITHYHSDHFGTEIESVRKHPAGGYALTGISALYEEVPASKLIDRSYPEYESVWLPSSSKATFYQEFVRYAVEQRGLLAESFRVGDAGQIRLLHRPHRYRNFRILNYAGSGFVWDGGQVVDAYASPEDRKENGMSCCFLLSYGDFDYYTGGDAGGNGPVALPVARAVGRPIEAMKADHHFSYHCMKDETMRIYRPTVVVTQGFTVRDIQPDYTVVDRLLRSDEVYPGPKYYYFTNMGESQLREHRDVYSRAAGVNGHVVIRVMPGGHEYYVIMLDDTDFEYRVKSIDGPFKCK
ncbi:MAG: MBL fold metallo-hydrolase [Bacteroidales bacterium]|nr:MBL fold metallo-hydrolase [Bacteroidales bacterium]